MCSPIKIIGIILLFMGLGMLLGIIIPCSTLLLAIIFIGIGIAIVFN